MLQLKGVSYSYPDDHRFQLKPMNLEIKNGEVLAIAGKSGSGKTTLLKLLAGLYSPNQGEVLYNKELLPDPSSKLIRGYPGFTIVHQDFELFPRYTVAQNIMHTMRRLNAEEKHKRLADLLETCDIEEIKDARVIDISGGQKQRTAIATALSGQPDVLIMDEPFSHLDQVNKSRLNRSLKKYIKEKEVTTIVSSHDPSDILGIADEVALLQDGLLLAINTPEKMYSEPRTEEEARLFGEVNVINKIDFGFYGLDIDNKASKALIRPSNIEIYLQGKYSAEVIEKSFAGWYTQFIVQDKNYTFSVFSTGPKDYEIGEEVRFDFLEEKISYIN